MEPPGNMPTPPASMNTNDMVMHMNFFWGKVAVVLFKGWPDNSLGMYILALLFVFILGFAVEVLSVSASVLKTGANPIVSSLSRTGVYAIRMALAYMVMLSVMSFNLGIFMVAVAGHAVGYFLVNFRKLAAAPGTEANSSTIDPKV